MKLPRLAIEGAAGVCLVVFPPVAAGLLLLLGAARRRRPQVTAWLWLWLGYSLPLVLVRLVTGGDPLIPALQAVFGFLIGSLVVIERHRVVLLGIVVGLLVSASTGLIERQLSRRLWWDATTPSDVEHLLNGVTELSGDSDGWRRNGVRLVGKTWTLADAGTLEAMLDEGAEGVVTAPTGSLQTGSYPDLELTLAVRGRSEAPGWQWYTNHPTTSQELSGEGNDAFTRITGLRAAVVRRVRSQLPLAGRSVRVGVELRAPEPVTSSTCGLGLRTFEPSAQHCEALAIGVDWREYGALYTFPDDAVQAVFEVVVGPTDVEYLDVRSLRVEESIDGLWTEVGVIEPAGLNLRVPVPGLHVFEHPTLNIVPEEGWRRHSLAIPGEPFAEAVTLTALLQIEAGTAVELRDVELRPLMDDATPAVAEAVDRSSFLYEQANLAGHSYVASGLLALALILGAAASRRGVFTTRSTAAACLVVTALLAAVIVTGSRTAFVGAVAGTVALVVMAAGASAKRTGRRLIAGGVLAAIALVAAVFAIVPTGDLLGRLAFWQADAPGANQVSRVEIWNLAVEGIREAPLAGWGADGFADLWRENHPDDGRAVPQHAHNFWLQLAVAYGLPGLLAASWLSIGLVFISLRARSAFVTAIVAAVLVMQLFDSTLTFVGVLLPLVGLLNLTAPTHTDPYSRNAG